MLLAQWGLGDRLAGEPGVWLCHACHDCTSRCPRDAKPGDVMQVARSVAIEELAAPRFMGKLVGNVRKTWPILIAVPIVFWLLLSQLGSLFHEHLSFEEIRAAGGYGYHSVVPHALIYLVFFPVAAIVVGAWWISGRRFWSQLAGADRRSGSFLSHLVPTLTEIIAHKRFSSCESAQARRWGHLLLVWGFVGAAVTSGLLIVAIYVLHSEMPLGIWHPFKILGNLSAVLLVVGGGMLIFDRFANRETSGASTAFDVFFIGLVAFVIVTGILAEAARLSLDPIVGYGCYIVHLGAVMCLFLTTPYSKFAHILYRTLAMVHERMVAAGQPETSRSEAEESSLATPSTNS